MVAAVALALAVPLVLCATLPPSRGGAAAKLPLQSLFLPIHQDVGLSVVPTEDGVQLEWAAEEPVGANTFTIVYRSPIEYTLEPTDPRVIRQGLLCEPTGHAPRCTIEMDEVGRTRGRAFVDQPRSGTWTYRIGIAANWRDDDDLGDPLVLSTPLNVRVD